MSATVVRADARRLPLADSSVDLIVTSPPYFALRSYRDGGEHYANQIGSEETPAAFVAALSECMVEWWRVLKPTGSVWVNLGDKYAGTGGANGNTGLGLEDGGDTKVDARGSARNNTRQTRGYRPKTLLGLPWRFANTQIDAGWILRAEIVWSKPNGLPESVTDRVRRSHETWFHFVKESRYFSAVDELREPASDYHRASDIAIPDIPGQRRRAMAHTTNPLGRAPGSVWTIPSESLIIPDQVRPHYNLPDHFAAFPQEWPRRIIRGWSPTGICTACGEGRKPTTDKTLDEIGMSHRTAAPKRDLTEPDANRRGMNGDHMKGRTQATITGYACACPTPDAPTRPAVVLDPFGGTGTVAGVARTLGRHGISVDLSADYCRLARWRIFESGHFSKTEQRTWANRQGQLL